jgi:hypothetical protein
VTLRQIKVYILAIKSVVSDATTTEDVEETFVHDAKAA